MLTEIGIKANSVFISHGIKDQYTSCSLTVQTNQSDYLKRTCAYFLELFCNKGLYLV